MPEAVGAFVAETTGPALSHESHLNRLQMQRAEVPRGEHGEQLANRLDGGCEAIHFGSLLAVLHVVGVRVRLERQEQFSHGRAGICLGFISWKFSTIGTASQRIDRLTGRRFADEFSVPDARFLGTVLAKKVLPAVDSAASLAARFVEQVGR